jgi:hypothetical protein
MIYGRKLVSLRWVWHEKIQEVKSAPTRQGIAQRHCCHGRQGHTRGNGSGNARGHVLYKYSSFHHVV